MKIHSSMAAVLPLISAAYSEAVKSCPSEASGACYQVSVPTTTSRSGSGEIFFQLSGPSSLQWVALGQGQQMAGSNIFVMYASEDGQNVTVSPRAGVGHREPMFNPETQVSLLDGSGISDGMMTANVRCSNCESWAGGEMDVRSSSSNWIWAVKEGDPLQSDDQSAEIERHDENGEITFDLTRAAGGSSMNPFEDAAPATATASSGPSQGQSSSPSMMRRNVVIAHGVLMALAFVLLFPLGALTIRILRSRRLVWIHGGAQLFAFSIAIAGFGMGVWIATSGDWGVNGSHQIIGIIVIALLLLQPALGLIHHVLFAKHHQPTAWALGHVWLGRSLLILGMINGGLGLRLADNTTKGKIAYGVIAGVVGVSYIAVVLTAWIRGRGRPGPRDGETGEKLTEARPENSPMGSTAASGSLRT
ncbi:MAG: hypothetical protein M1837_003621 [Sclerophora amabilis]|nr:MAG: hypothetical protein M1837_003621 [Sclerophora amabilis]